MFSVVFFATTKAINMPTSQSQFHTFHSLIITSCLFSFTPSRILPPAILKTFCLPINCRIHLLYHPSLALLFSFYKPIPAPICSKTCLFWVFQFFFVLNLLLPGSHSYSSTKTMPLRSLGTLTS